jgi:hypothetical protein
MLGRGERYEVDETRIKEITTKKVKVIREKMETF